MKGINELHHIFVEFVVLLLYYILFITRLLSVLKLAWIHWVTHAQMSLLLLATSNPVQVIRLPRKIYPTKLKLSVKM